MASILTSKSRNIFITRIGMFPIAKRNLANLRTFKFNTQEWTQKMAFLKRNHLCFAPPNRSISVRIPPDVIQESLSDTNKQRIIKKLELVEKRQLLNCSEEAAVLFPFCVVDNKPSLLFTLRSSALVTHRGQVRLVISYATTT